MLWAIILGESRKGCSGKAKKTWKAVPTTLFCMTVPSTGLGMDWKDWVNLHFLHVFTLSLRLASWNLLSVMKPHRTFHWFKALSDIPQTDGESTDLSGRTLFCQTSLSTLGYSAQRVFVLPTSCCWRATPPFLPSLPQGQLEESTSFPLFLSNPAMDHAPGPLDWAVQTSPSTFGS